ncbi:hypothetical protein [Alkaliphilus hydrothermalis]|uniref:Uncharacterized protein n=1 Tax=Alkaliphilus hydrothermalis TaxID=1482730 RepID=A0ABS2NQL6_9FIRM|nr:hypothetical protein [Alkaliphilus hydrothermalis]MBM7615240.1 hypothetical protein [Alkaliphilus hydrothermalis]
MKKTLITLSLILFLSAPALLDVNAYKYDPNLLKAEDTVIISPSLRHN